MFFNKENEKRLAMLAETDEIYNIWKNSLEECEITFREYADAQPEEICRMLWSYAEAGRMMQQRKVNLACVHMIFPEEEG